MLNQETAKKRINQLLKEDSEFGDQLSAYYDQALEYISRHLAKFYEHYAVDNQITVSQAARSVDKWGMQQWKSAIDELNASGWLPETKKRAKILGQTAGLNVGSMMGAIAGLGIASWLDKAIQKSINRTTRIGVDERNYLRENGLSTARKAGDVAKAGKALTDTIWTDGDRLIDDVRSELIKSIQTGKTVDELKAKLAKSLKPTPGTNIADRMVQSSSKIDRLIRSESAKLMDEIDTEAYQKAGVEYVNWVTEPGACARCQDLRDNSPYPIDEAPALVTDSHPNCRCSKVPTDKSDVPSNLLKKATEAYESYKAVSDAPKDDED